MRLPRPVEDCRGIHIDVDTVVERLTRVNLERSSAGRMMKSAINLLNPKESKRARRVQEPMRRPRPNPAYYARSGRGLSLHVREGEWEGSCEATHSPLGGKPGPHEAGAAVAEREDQESRRVAKIPVRLNVMIK